MGNNLVIVESPAKARTINKILGSDYVVKASMGHVRDLPEKEFGIDIQHGFKPKYVTIKGREKVVKELATAARDVERIYLAPDPDREGEAIAWHLMAALKGKVPEDQFFRVTYNEITAPAIRKAFSEPGRINENKVDSQQARRVLDRLVGYKVSPLLWRRIRGASSAGRVQSVALRLVCEREREILHFTAEEYWIVGARVRKGFEPRDPFEIRLAKIDGQKAEIRTQAQAEKVRADLEGRPLAVSSVTTREVTKRAMPPYITSTLQQAGSSVYGFSPAHTMRVAQKLYEGVDFGEGPVGLITYMRTDSFNISREAQSACREFIHNNFGDEFLPGQPNFYRSRASAQEAHEAIRPTDVTRTPDHLASVLAPDELKLYRLIWQRFVASQMAPARIAQRTVEVEAIEQGERKTPYLFRATSSEIVFPGYMRVTGAEEKRKAEENNDEVDRLPPLEKGEGLEWLEWLQQQKFTQPPPRFTEASLVRALEENGVGRPSTYAQVLSTLQTRKYVVKDKRMLVPTEVGMKVCEFLVTHLGELFDVKFTAGMENLLDEVESGSVRWVAMMEKFHAEFLAWLEKAKGPPADPAAVGRLLELVAGVREWAPESKRGRRTYSDEKFVNSIRTQLESGKPISEQQFEGLKRVACRYADQVPVLREQAEALGLVEQLARAAEEAEPPREETIRKLQILSGVRFSEPKKVGRRTYDDKVFAESLRQQVERGRRLSAKQIHHLDRLFSRYADQIEGYEKLASDLGVHSGEAEDKESGPLLEALKHIREWKPAVMRGRREWDDHKFYESLSRQFAQRRSLSPKQLSSLKKLAGRYAEQIPDFKQLAEQFGISTRRGKQQPKESAE
ncbi:MAG: DNA topoisomerase 1 [Verrucomicrobia bacterium ADurb.Bin345]|nr:MAG: DNA topoisomerase 1 [Verrucomicrobia bacterium ADurb.Bin345]